MKQSYGVIEWIKHAFTSIHKNLNKPIKFIFAVIIFTSTLSAMFYMGMLNSYAETNITQNGVVYALNNPLAGRAAVVGHTGDLGATVVIPSTIEDENHNSYNVVYINNQAFQGCSSVTSMTIPNTITYIGGLAFQGCSSITSMTIPNSVTLINDSAFSDCSSLESITIPNSVTSLGYYSFQNCSSLASATISNHITSLNPGVFYGCSGLESITIPNSVTSIGNSAFYGCSGLTSITLPDSVTSIGTSAFQSCSKITNVILSNTTVSIGWYAFSGCTSLTSITIPNSVTSINNYAFQNCSKLTSITIPNSVTSTGEGIFWGCSGLTSITLPDFVTSINNYVFYRCSSLESINIPDSVTSIGTYAFASCAKLTSLAIPNSVTSIGIYAFYDCPKITSVTLSNSITSIGANAFYYCTSLTNITIPSSVTSIGSDAFNGCSNLSKILVSSNFNFNVFQGSGVTPKDNNNKYDIFGGYQNGNFHDYAWSDNQDGTHTGTCTACGATVTATHEIPSWTNNYDGTHIGTCIICGATVTANHEISSWSDNQDGTHIGTCTICDGIITEEHTYGSEPILSTEPLDENFGVDKYKCEHCEHIKKHYVIKENTHPMKYPNIDQVPPDDGEDVITYLTPKASASTVIVQDPFGTIGYGGEFDLNVEDIEKSSENYNNYVNRLGDYRNSKNIKFFNINPQIDNEDISGELYNPVRILFEIPESWDADNIKIVLLTDSGNVEFCQKLDSVEGKNYVAAWTNHFSTYAIIDTSDNPNPNDGGNEKPEPNDNNNSEDTSNENEESAVTDESEVKSGDNSALWIAGLCVILLISGLILLVIKRKKDN